MVEQNLAMATAMADRQLVMVAGRIFAETTAAELANDPDAAAPLPGRGARSEHDASCSSARWTPRATSTPSCATASARRASRSCWSTRASSASRWPTPDVSREEVARAAGADHAELAAAGDRGAAMEVMGRGAGVVLAQLHAEGRLQGVAAVGGSGGSSVAAAAMRDLPVGVPKLIVSTVASGDTRPYVGATDVTMTYSVVDISGINRISARILANAAGAIAGMAQATVPAGAATTAR